MRQLAILTAVLIAVSACSADPAGPGISLTAEQRSAVAATTAALVAADVGMMASRAAGGSEIFALGGDLDQGNCTFTSGQLICTATLGSLDGQLSLTFNDASGASQSAYDDQTTATVTADTHVSGDLSQGAMALSFEHTSSFLISGLAGSETSRHWSGNAATTVSSSSFSGTDGSTFSISSAIDAVVVPTGGTGPYWPTSGRIIAQVHLDTGASSAGTANVQVDFNSTGQVPMLVNGTKFILDLAGRTATAAG